MTVIMASVGPYGYKRDAVRVKVMKYEERQTPENRKFSVDPQITSFEVLQSLVAKAFDIRGEFTVCYKFLDDYGQETYLSLLSDWDLDAAFISASEPYLDLRVDVKPFSESCEEWDSISGQGTDPDPVLEIRQAHKIPGIIMNKMGRTLNSVVQRAFNLAEEHTQGLYYSHQQHQPPTVSSVPPRHPLTDAEFRQYLDPIGQVVRAKELRSVIYLGGIEPSLRKVVWKHLLNVYPEGMSGKDRMDYMRKKADEYRKLRDSWKEMYRNEQMVGDLAYVTGMVKKDVLRTDRHHVFYAGSDDNKNIASLFNILTTYALNHPAVSYCQGMSDLASPLLVTMNDEAHAYICFCALMQRLAPNFLLDGITMTKRFQHLAEGLLYYDPSFYNYLKLHQADDLLFCYRWLLLEMKREFAFDEALRMLEVMWSSVAPQPPEKELPLFQKEFCASPVPISPRPRETPYTKICALRRQSSSASLSLDGGLAARGRGRLARQGRTRPYASMDESQLSTAQASGDKAATRIVKNLNEFLSFDKSNSIKGRKLVAVEEHKKKKGSIEEDSSPDDSSETLSKSLPDEDTGRRRKKDDDGSSPDDSSEFFPMTTSMTRELRLELESLDRQVFEENEKPRADAYDDVFVWENPLRVSATPDEQVELEFDTNAGEIFETEGNSVKSVTPIKLMRKITYRNNSSENAANGLTGATSLKGKSLLERRKCTLEEIPVASVNGNIPIACEEPAEFNILKVSSEKLPPPEEFGGGNPFLMFLCITVLRQHRDLIIKSGMDYNEMAMHFDKMVRKHDVTKVLNQARMLFAEYMKQYNKSLTHLSI